MVRAPSSITTLRLRLRRPVAGDAEAIFARYASDAEVTRFMGWPTHRSLIDTRDFLAFAEMEWARHPAGAYLIETLDTRLLLGSTGLSIESATEAETGYVLARDAWGRGYATEALAAMVELHAHPGFPNLPDRGPDHVVRYSLRFEATA